MDSEYSYAYYDNTSQQPRMADRNRMDKNIAYNSREDIYTEPSRTASNKLEAKSKFPIAVSVVAVLIVLVVLALVTAAAALGVTLSQQAKSYHQIHTLKSQLNNSSNEMQSLSEDFQNLKRLVVAQLETSFGYDRNLPASSCQQVLNYNSSSPNGYYWIVSADGNAVLRYCDMTRTCGNITGGWMRITALDMRVANTPCPIGLRERVHPGQRLCGRDIDGEGCSGFFIDTNVPYSQVCGKIIAYQFRSTDSFERHEGTEITIDTAYLDGISLTYSLNPRKHIWSFAAAHHEIGTIPQANCPCTNVTTKSAATPPPSFVGEDYFCDTGAENLYATGSYGSLYSEDPLWDGAGCGRANMCCSLNNPPWFFKQLPSSTSDDIEMRVCSDEELEAEDVLIEQIEIYVH